MTDREKIELHKWISAGIMGLGLVIIFLIDGMDLPGYFYIFGFLVIIAGIIYGFVKIRCPHCHSFIPIRGLIPNYCPYCGKRIN